MSKAAIQQRKAEDHTRYLERRHNVMQRMGHGMKLKPMTSAILQMFRNGLPYRWGRP
jgi:hypothetical protein